MSCSSSTAASRGSFSSSSSGSYSSSSWASWSAATSTGPTCYGPRSTTKASLFQVASSGLDLVAETPSILQYNAPLVSPPTSPESIHAILGGPCPSPQATSSTPSTPAAGPGPTPSRTRDMMSAIIPSITSHNHTPASYTTSPHPTSSSSHHKKNFVPPSIKLNQFFASIESGASAPTPTPAPAAKAVGGGGGRSGGVAGLVGSTGNKFKGLAGGVANSAKGKMAQAKKAKALNAQKVKADKVAAAQAAQAEAEAEQAARRRQQQQVTYEDEYDSEDERYFDDEYDDEYDDDDDYSSSGDEGDSESEGSAPHNVGSASRSTDAQHPHPPHLAALSADTTYTFKPLPTLPQYKGSRESVDSDEDVVAHVEYATERDFVESTSARVTAHEKDPDHPAAKHAHQSRYSSDSEVEPDDRDRDDEYRGRSRRPRLLWRSQLAEPTVNVLDHYCREYYAMELPKLKGKGSPEGRKWSRQLDQAGL
ncbi:BZ3500_MvSof-1268-A1-R1_Chr7-1g09179 [Microbotryum saponariae]|uniref:BZ3500_MvSof-1268-A1-R1_Chr7-1g09179 protein n=1 Tax=Microbotryum saponariae TaxID=289078 RepID=A0A2X0ND13_9BASI|nr:BZ3501_MvSof-1269-A2-R1_Chr7-1g08884 [Microbotryum saponariae]SDA02947.1 BZ3500_MvSof-1268-A1-R1_Chr7-1g09179 [Microbotryum saponariae]